MFKWIYAWIECERCLLYAIILIITLFYYNLVLMCYFVKRVSDNCLCRTSVCVGQMSMSDKCPQFFIQNFGQMSVSAKCPCRPNVRVGQMPVSDKCPFSFTFISQVPIVIYTIIIFLDFFRLSDFSLLQIHLPWHLHFIKDTKPPKLLPLAGL